jgi:hypothetical protein
MAKVTTAVVYPAVGFMGATNCVPVFGKSVEEVRALGRTDRERFDLAVEVVAYFYRGVATPQVQDNPAAFFAPWAQVAAL